MTLAHLLSQRFCLISPFEGATLSLSLSAWSMSACRQKCSPHWEVANGPSYKEILGQPGTPVPSCL